MRLRQTTLTGCALALFISTLAAPLAAQTIEFSDDFESGTSAWTLTGTWGTSTLYAHGGANSLTESPTGNYADALNISATMNTGVDLTSALDANLTFWAIYDIEGGFDFMYVDGSLDGGGSWINLAVFDGENNLTPWVQYSFSLGGFVGNSDVRVRFRFESDGYLNYDGMYIDDLEITSSSTDAAPPLLLHDGPEHYEGTVGDFNLTADVVDISGVASTDVTYRVDGGAWTTVAGVPVAGDEYSYAIPAQAPGAWVDYFLTATDASPMANAVVSDTQSYIAGFYIGYDNASINFVTSFGPLTGISGTGAAVRISLAGVSDLRTVLFRNYTDPGRPNDSIEVHVWSDAGGMPGTDLVTPFHVFPEATIGNPNPMTRVDLRPYASSLSGLSGDIFIGFFVNAGEAWAVQTTPGIAGRTWIYSGFWTNITDDYHFRAITGPPLGAPDAEFSWDAAADPDIAFTDLSTNSPTSWSWDFGDGGSSTLQNPTHTFATDGTYNVCLTATNGTASDTECQNVEVDGYLFPPVASFSFDDTGDPTIAFTDLSTNTPTAWDWDFADGNTSTDQDPTHTYTVNGTYDVCLVASNADGSSSASCQLVTVQDVVSGIGEPGFLSEIGIVPNPADAMATIRWPDALREPAVLQLLSAEGRILGSWTLAVGARAIELDLTEQPTGTLWIRIDNASGTATRALLHR